MAKIRLIKVKVPGLNVEHEFLVPGDMQISKVTELLAQLLRSEYPKVRVDASAAAELLQASSGLALEPKGTLNKSGIGDGDTFILM